MKDGISRRRFLQQTAMVSAMPLISRCSARGSKDANASRLPRRTLGRTGMEVSVLAFGGGSFFQKLPDGQWEPLVQKALDLGVNYFDEASAYHHDKKNPHSETRMGQILPPYRKSIHICTKLDERDPEKAKGEFEQCLQRLKTDYVDVLLVHAIRDNETDTSLIEKGIYSQLRKWKEQGAARHIGFSSMMTDGPRTKEWIDALDPDVVLLAISATKYGNIAEHAIPAAQAHRTGFIAMKMLKDVVGNDVSAKELLHYAWTQPGVASLCVGHSSIQQLQENVDTLCEFAQTTGQFDRSETERKVAYLANSAVLSWTRPDYKDGADENSMV